MHKPAASAPMDRCFQTRVLPQQGGSLHHASSAATGAVGAPFAAKCYKSFEMAGVATNPQKAMLQPATLEKLIEFALHVRGDINKINSKDTYYSPGE